MGWLTVSCPANTQGQLTFADVEDAISILLMDLTDESREGGAIEGVPTNPRLVDDSIKSGPWFFGFDNQWIAMQIAAAADGKLIVDTADSSLVCNLTTLKTSKDEGAHLSSHCRHRGPRHPNRVPLRIVSHPVATRLARSHSLQAPAAWQRIRCHRSLNQLLAVLGESARDFAVLDLAARRART
mmetsp:Transcript_17989/g.27093  ORF Transcript_17989/g.27093 Transcript_17989/m.27093 type:complete len:184 (+) Transcript_17989:2-553(+)